MKKILKSGKVIVGECGKPSGLFDSCGKELFVGDVVAASRWENFYNAFIFNDLLVVVETSFLDRENEGFFVMGLFSEHQNICYKDGEETSEDDPAVDFKQSIIIQNHDKWQLQLVKSYKDTVHMEKNGGITTYIEEV